MREYQKPLAATDQIRDAIHRASNAPAFYGVDWPIFVTTKEHGDLYGRISGIGSNARGEAAIKLWNFADNTEYEVAVPDVDYLRVDDEPDR